jgi:four helix bundle protein
MEQVKTFENLIVWRKSIQLTTRIYQITKMFPKEEIFGLGNQLRRAAVSVPSNIAEGYGRHTRIDYKRFLSISLGSIYELQTQLRIGLELEFIPIQEFQETLNLSKEIDRMLYAIIKKL